MKKIRYKSKGIKLLEKAKKIIPGGNQLLSKRSEIFLPGQWPSYYKKAKGCKVWDLDNKSYYDFAGMGVTTCILGYADNDVNNAVKKAINNASMNTLNSYEEVELAEKLIALHPWAEQVRFARTGGEACAIAIRLARSYTNKDIVLFCGYHGWHDWYLSANLEKNHLDDQLLPGLKSKGVPRSLSESIYPFKVNDIKSFNKAVDRFKGRIAAVIMEPVRSDPPNINFLKSVRSTAKKIGAIFIFDEITSGFRETVGGFHLKLNINPDVAILSKAMSNGYPSSAIIGVKPVLDEAQNTFISSCMWTERIGFVAALATIKKIQKKNIINHLIKYGKMIKNGWSDAATNNKLDINISGLDPIPQFSFNYKNNKELETFFIQELKNRGFLANTRLGTTYSYNKKIVNMYLDLVDDVFRRISKILANSSKVPLKGPVRHSTFQRLI